MFCSTCNCPDHGDMPIPDETWPCPLMGGKPICMTCCVYDMDASDACRATGRTPQEIASACNACGRCGHKRDAEDYDDEEWPPLPREVTVGEATVWLPVLRSDERAYVIEAMEQAHRLWSTPPGFEVQVRLDPEDSACVVVVTIRSERGVDEDVEDLRRLDDAWTADHPHDKVILTAYR